MVVARLEKAKLLGYEDFAAYVLEENMAKNEKNVYDLLNKIWIPALVKAKEELADINAEIRKKVVTSKRKLGLALLFRKSQESEI